MQKRYKVAVVIGRFQPFHTGHEALMRTALMIADKLVVVIGSTNIPRTPKNPFNYAERYRMVADAFPDDDVEIYGVEDTLYSDQQWASEVQFAVDTATKANNTDVVLVGHHRDNSSFYLDMFPQWKFEEMPVFNDDISGTDIRDNMYHHAYMGDMVPESSNSVIEEFTADSDIDDDHPFSVLVREYLHIQDYLEMWKSSPYPVNFVTTDAVVVQSGHVLMIERGGFPGKGLWALPGGFLDTNERIVDGIIRELREETKLKVAEKVLKGSIKTIEFFDAPNRSERGRTLTHAALILLEDGHGLPKVKGADDAADARWIPLSMLRRMRDKIFEDHFDIIFKLTNTL